MADEEELFDESETDLEESSGLGKKRIILLAVLVLLLGGGGGAFVFFSGILDGDEKANEIAAAGERLSPAETVFYELPVMITNLSGSGQRPGFLKAKVSLELEDKSGIDLLDQLQPRIIDILQVYLRELRIDDLRGSRGLTGLRRTLLARINAAVKPVKVSGVLFQEILVQ